MVISSERRSFPRISINFPAIITLVRTPTEVLSVTQNISQSGAFILSSSCSAFQCNDQTEIEFSFPPDFTGQEDTLVLKGLAIVIRIEADRGGIAIEFLKQLNTFEIIWGT